MTTVLKVAQKHKQMENLFPTELYSQGRESHQQRHREAQQHDVYLPECFSNLSNQVNEKWPGLPPFHISLLWML